MFERIYSTREFAVNCSEFIVVMWIVYVFIKNTKVIQQYENL